MSEYYGVTRSTDHLAHYGIKGMKWGVRKAIARGDQRKLDRHFRKAAKKLAKLQDIGLNSNKSYAKAAAYGAAAAGVGTLALKGTSGIRKAIKGKHINAINRLAEETKKYQSLTGSDLNRDFINAELKRLAARRKKMNDANEKLDAWDKPKTTYYFEKDAKGNMVSKSRTTPSTEKIIRIGAGVAAAGLAANAAKHLYRARNDAEYRERADQFKNAMDEAFAGTKYAGKYVVPPKQRKRNRRV